MSTSSQVTQKEIRILDQILLLDLSGIHLLTARKKLKPTMLEGTIPPATLASLGSMRVIDPEELKPFEKIKRRATALVAARGIKFLGGYAIPQDVIKDLVEDLNFLKDQFYEAKKGFISRYDALVDDWINREWEKSEWRDAIRASTTPCSVVENALQFGFAACRVAPDNDKDLGDMLEGQVRGLADELYSDIVNEAEELLATGLATRGHVDQRTLATLRKLDKKLQGLMFLSSDVRSLSAYISDLINSLPTSGVVSGSQYDQVVVLVSSLSDENSVKNLIKNINRPAGTEPEAEAEAEVVIAAMPKPKPKPEPKPEPEVEVEAASEDPAQEPEIQVPVQTVPDSRDITFWI